MSGRNQQVNDFLLRLDNAAKIHPSIKDKKTGRYCQHKHYCRQIIINLPYQVIKCIFKL